VAIVKPLNTAEAVESQLSKLKYPEDSFEVRLKAGESMPLQSVYLGICTCVSSSVAPLPKSGICPHTEDEGVSESQDLTPFCFEMVEII
jgi:hypothetical protein